MAPAAKSQRMTKSQIRSAVSKQKWRTSKKTNNKKPSKESENVDICLMLLVKRDPKKGTLKPKVVQKIIY